MPELNDDELENLEVARRWCAAQGTGWAVVDTAGRGGTAPVFTVSSPNGEFALKVFDKSFSEGVRGAESAKRIEQQLKLGEHSCPYIVKTYDGGKFEDRLFLLMNKARGAELEKRLQEIPRGKIRGIISQLAEACIFLRDNGLCHRDIKSANLYISDDFNQVCLLDLSVIRTIEDPVGVGTDHDGQLPVVATSRYSPPEYLFRLIDPGEALWHALDVYQIGGVLHDLIMQEPMFQGEYRSSRENRYRFAYIVATVDPVVDASDVPADLVLLARRALDKNWQRRSILQLEDFLDSAAVRRERGLSALGLSGNIPASAKLGVPAGPHRRVREIALGVEQALLGRLRERGVTATHQTKATSDDREKIVILGWNSSELANDAPMRDVEFSVAIRLSQNWEGDEVDLSLALSATVEGKRQVSTMALAAQRDTDNVEDRVVAMAVAALGDLAAQVLSA